MGLAFVVLLAIALGACSTEPPPGTITFGSVESPETSFGLHEEVAWTVFLATQIEGQKVNIVITRSGEHTEMFGYEQFITHPGATTLVNRMPLGRFLPEPGDYVMRYVTTDGRVVAEGEFELVR